MSKVNLQSVLEKLVNEDRDQASGLLHQWFVEKCAEINKSLVEDVHIHIHGDDEDGVEVGGEHGKPLGVSPDFADPEDELECDHLPIGGMEEEGDENPFADENEPTDDLGGETGDDMGEPEDLDGLDGEEGDDVDAEPDLGGETGDTDPQELEDQVEDLEAELQTLKDQLKAFIDGDEGSEKPEGEDDAEADAEGDHEEPDGDEDAEGKEPQDKEEDEVEESFDFSDLEESFQLEKIADPGLDGSKEIGKDGTKVNVNTTSPIPQRKTTDRVGGKTVEIKSTQHKGYDREPAPKVSDKTPLRNQSVGNAMRDYTPISKEGDKSATLNKKDGFGSDSPKSPIGAGATDLRGDTFKRK